MIHRSEDEIWGLGIKNHELEFIHIMFYLWGIVQEEINVQWSQWKICDYEEVLCCRHIQTWSFFWVGQWRHQGKNWTCSGTKVGTIQKADNMAGPRCFQPLISPAALFIRHSWISSFLLLVYRFVFAAVTSYHKLSSINQPRFIILQFWRSEVQNRSHWANTKILGRLHSFLEALGQPVLLFFPASEAAGMTLIVESFIFIASKAHMASIW